MLFKDILEYTFHFNNEVLNSLLTVDYSPEKSTKLINHIINAQQIWNQRIVGEKPTIGVWEIRPFSELVEINKLNYQTALSIIENVDLNTIVKYSNSSGQTFENNIQDMLFHSINHSTYHRGQIATDFKENNIKPLVTDYIFYKRTAI